MDLPALHPEGKAGLRKVRNGRPELFCQVTLLGGGHSAQAMSLATETVIQYLNPFLLQSAALVPGGQNPQDAELPLSSSALGCVIRVGGKNTRRGTFDLVIWTVVPTE